MLEPTSRFKGLAMAVARFYSPTLLRPLSSFRPSSFRALSSFPSSSPSSPSTSPSISSTSSSPPTANDGWIQRWVPARCQPFLYLTRMDKPIGTWLLYIPCTWSVLMAAFHTLDASSVISACYRAADLLALMGVGAIVMRGAGCTINDMWDKDFDRKVERTKNRPIAAGQISMPQAWVFLAGQLSVGLAILTQLNTYSILLGASSMGLVATYPLAKRFTFWPQAVLGWPALVGSSDWSVTLPLYTAGFFWTLFYDTIYAHQDKVDDAKIGVKSTALHLGSRSKMYLCGFGTATISSLALAGLSNECGWPFYLSLLAASSHMAWILKSVNLGQRESCNRAFNDSQWTGMAVTAGITADMVLKAIHL